MEGVPEDLVIGEERKLVTVLFADPVGSTALATLEQECCAFATWSVHNHTDEPTLDVTAESAEGIAAVQAMFATLELR